MRKDPLPKKLGACVCAVFLMAAALSPAEAQICPSAGSTTINANDDTYFPGIGTVAAGATSISLGAAGYGTNPIHQNDVVLIIQMQGATMTLSNNANYGASTGSGSGYLNNASLMAGLMEYAVAENTVPLAGGTLTVSTGLTHSYKTAAYVAGTSGQYTYQVIRVPLYYNATLNGTIKPPGWNGSIGGIYDIYVSNTLSLNGQTIDASSLGFRGGGGKNSGSGTGTNTDFRNTAANKAGGSKGEGIAGTPIYLDSINAASLIIGAVEGYPNGSYTRGAPGNAGGGATDGQPSSNSNNAGGGGGANGGVGGGGGNSWNSNLATGGRGGAVFAQQSPARLVMGGGGGAGSTDGGTGFPGAGFASSGAPGGGMVLITAGAITGTGTILANGAPPNTTLQNDGSGGGGAGGSVLIITSSPVPGLTVHANGSAGASNTGGGTADHGPGGGGGGGIVYSNVTLGSVTVTGGVAGTTFDGTTYNATNGSAGISSQSITMTSAAPFPVICNGLLALGSIMASAATDNGNILVSWQTSTDNKIQHYDIERSFDSAGFTTIATVSADNSSYIDLSPGNGTLYYRVRQVDIDGNNLYSNIVAIKQAAYITGTTIAPNPASGSATLRFTSEHNTLVSISLYDMTGNRVRYTQFPAVSGMNTVPVDNLQQLPNGMYIVQLNNGKDNENVKVFIRH